MAGAHSDDGPFTFAAVGDVHGHLQLALCVVARWQCLLNQKFDAVFLCGDVGTFTDYWQLDNATLRHAKANPCELEFLQQWATHPPAPWLEHIFLPQPDGLGLDCPVVMVHGNHEGFPHLETLAPRRPPSEFVGVHDLPTVDPGGHLRLLPSGWRLRTPGGYTVAGVGGMERGQRRADYHRMAYVDDGAVELLLSAKVDVLLTHQGPSSVQGEHGSDTLQMLLDAGVARVWFHGHGTPNPDPIRAGPDDSTLVVPLGDVAFGGRGHTAGDPGLAGWSWTRLTPTEVSVTRDTPPFWRDYRRGKWHATPDRGLVCPDLVPFLS
jgi:hypothetical protein